MVYIILGTGFEEMEAICPCDMLRRAGVEVQFAGIGGKLITGGKGIAVQADCTVEDMDLQAMEMIRNPQRSCAVSAEPAICLILTAAQQD